MENQIEQWMYYRQKRWAQNAKREARQEARVVRRLHRKVRRALKQGRGQVRFNYPFISCGVIPQSAVDKCQSLLPPEIKLVQYSRQVALGDYDTMFRIEINSDIILNKFK